MMGWACKGRRTTSERNGQNERWDGWFGMEMDGWTGDGLFHAWKWADGRGEVSGWVDIGDSDKRGTGTNEFKHHLPCAVFFFLAPELESFLKVAPPHRE